MFSVNVLHSPSGRVLASLKNFQFLFVYTCFEMSSMWRKKFSICLDYDSQGTVQNALYYKLW